MLIVLVLVVIGIFYTHRNGKVPDKITEPAPDVGAIGSTPTRIGQSGREIFDTKAAQLNQPQLAEFESTFNNKIKAALERWSQAYSGHLPFEPEKLSAQNLYGQIGRGTNYCVYTFMLNSSTLAVESVNGSMRVNYLNSPGSEKLLQLPNGEPINTSLSVTREQISSMLKADSGIDFPPAEIRIIPTAFSSAMNGGVNVSVGGDPKNIASWKYTLVFGPDGNLKYYCRGKE